MVPVRGGLDRYLPGLGAEMTKVIRAAKGQQILVDDEDYEYLSRFKWSVNHSGYAVGMKRGHMRMHRWIIKARDDQQVDHINMNTLDNRRCNLRFCTNSQNRANEHLRANNKSGFRGVCWKKHAKKFMARIGIAGKEIYLGYYPTAEEAARVYDAKAKELYGQFARTNSMEVFHD